MAAVFAEMIGKRRDGRRKQTKKTSSKSEEDNVSKDNRKNETQNKGLYTIGPLFLH